VMYKKFLRRFEVEGDLAVVVPVEMNGSVDGDSAVTYFLRKGVHSRIERQYERMQYVRFKNIGPATIKYPRLRVGDQVDLSSLSALVESITTGLTNVSAV
jgi:hypothetical protein